MYTCKSDEMLTTVCLNDYHIKTSIEHNNRVKNNVLATQTKTLASLKCTTLI